MDRWKGRVALVTGASAGIGAEIAKQLAREGMTVVGVARNVEKIETLSKQLDDGGPGKLVALKCDVRNEDEIKLVFESVRSLYGGVDVCVNNAGLAHNSPLLTGSTESWKEMLDTNVLAPTVITREFMTDVKRRGIDDAHVIFINSMSGHRVASGPNLHFYDATRYAMTALVEGTRQELREMKSNNRVTSISPGIVRTEFNGRRNKAEDMKKSMKEYDSAVYNGQVLECEDIASAVIFALSAPPRMEINDMWIRPTAQVF